MEARIKKLEMITTRLMRRTRKRVIALITPYPISSASFGNVRGSILRYMFPCEGNITKGMIRLGSKLKGGAKLTIHLFDELGETAKGFIVDRKTFLIETSIKVNTGDCLNISIESVDPEETISEVWISFLWVPVVNDVEVKSYLLSEIENEILKEENELLT